MSTKTRVLVVTDSIYPYHNGGKEFRYHHIFRAATGRDDIDVTVATMNWWNGTRTITINGITHRSVAARRDLYRNGRRSITQAIRFAAGTLRLCRVDADVIEADTMPYLCLFPLAAICRLRNIPLVVSWHEYWGRPYWQTYMGNRVTGAVAAAVEHAATKLPHHVLSGTPETTRQLIAAGIAPNRISTIAHGAEQHPDPIDNPPQGIVVVGRLIAHKRVDLVLHAVAALAQPIPVTIIGDGPEKRGLEHLSDQLGLGGHVTFTGTVDAHTDVLQHIRDAAVLVAGSEREGFGIAVAEALAQGTPVVCNNHPDNEARHLITSPALGTVTDGTAAAFAAAIGALLHQRAPRPQVTAAFTQDHPELSWETHTRRYFDTVKHHANPRRTNRRSPK